MSKPSSSKTRISIFSIVGLGIIVLGVGCICLSMIKIWSPSVQNVAVDNSSTPITSTAAGTYQYDKAVEKDEPTQSDKSSAITSADKILYPVYPIEGEIMGSLSIPTLKLEQPVFQGTGTDELVKGVGHFQQSVMPGENNNCVLSGHRDTVFRKLGELKIGNQLIVQTSAGIFTYEVSSTRIVDKNDKTVIVPADHAVLTLTTCYPFIYIGPAPDRYIVSADLVSSKYTAY